MFRAPSSAGLPPVSYMVDDIPASRQQLARHLGISARTLATYYRTNSAPRAIMLALFHETKWGRSAADCEAARYGAVYFSLAESLKRENATLRGQIEALEHERHASEGLAANTPFYAPGAAQRKRPPGLPLTA